jgi:hypothetical protein
MVTLVSQNEFSKIFEESEREIKLVVSKAFDEETNKHYLVCSIPTIKELNVNHIQFPIEFEKEEERNKTFDEFDGAQFIDGIYNQVKAQTDEAKKNDQKTEDIESEEI